MRPTAFCLPLIALAALLAAHPSPLHAQMRQGQPATLAAPPPPPDRAAVAADRFRSAYARARSPRIIIFWNRALEDEVASDYENYERERSVRSNDYHGLKEETSGPTGQSTREEGGSVEESSRETTSGTRRLKPVRRGVISSEAVDWRIQQGFKVMLGRGGAQLVDRTMVMRLAGVAAKADAASNIQELEMVGINRYADILLEILATPDSSSPNGLTFRVTARDLKTTRPLIDVVSNGIAPAQRMPYVAGAGGFVRAATPPSGPSDIGRQLGLDVLSALAAAL